MVVEEVAVVEEGREREREEEGEEVVMEVWRRRWRRWWGRWWRREEGEGWAEGGRGKEQFRWGAFFFVQ